ncbi:hypothetical protein [Reichenbachiella sp. MSK19-1]|uniref:hypothetical protein n=1 Tax=Reichenbachiella sp. MSK19-1 TaxID=1897631 RepID=UPI000E6C32A7|nr:hypothetical protein [Reichenbachiella sp. MSK19-1]RJE72782.1 hypothetical protein BGP76_02170 [Reichenbachiella sp. MSK19-1]
MERKTLKFLRLLIPGLTLILAFLPLLHQTGFEIKMGEGWLAYSLLIIPSLVIGAMYHMLNIRFFITNYSHRQIDLYITSSLLKVYNKEVSQEQLNTLKDKHIKHIFYNLVDNDNSLTAKGQLVYFNGLLWTSTADIFLMSIFSSLIYIVTGLYLDTMAIWLTGILLVGAGLLSFAFHILTVFRHINLSNDQIEYIETNCRQDLIDKIDGVL